MNSKPLLRNNPFFELDDFQSLVWVITGSNLTSQVKFLTGGIQLVELEDHGVHLEVPARSCSLGHRLELTLSEKDQQIEIVGIVERIEPAGPERSLIQVDFRKFSQSEWKTFLGYVASQQMRMNELLKGTRK